jgi:hypothetical protein
VTHDISTDHETDETSEHTYFIGDAVDSLDDQELSKFNAFCRHKKTALRRLFYKLADWTGLEPATSGVTGQHSNQLNYQSAILLSGAGTKIRTRDPLITNQLLYQLSYASNTTRIIRILMQNSRH